MSLNLVKVKVTERTAMATTQIEVKGTPVEVLVVGLAEEGNMEQLADNGRFYLSPTIAHTAFDDIELNRKVTPVFEGRSYDEMLSYLTKNAK